MDLADQREQYGDVGLDVGDLAPDPFAQFERWFADWAATDPYDATAVTLATVDDQGWPAARVVLLKGVDPSGFVIYTNYQSAKGRALDATRRAALCFGWVDLSRQVRVVGNAERVDGVESDAYFATRPRGSQLGAWASPQSTVISDRTMLQQALAEAEARFTDEVPRPEHWGGYRIIPRTIEFWQGRPNRLHDRLRYGRATPGADWTIERLAP